MGRSKAFIYFFILSLFLIPLVSSFNFPETDRITNNHNSLKNLQGSGSDYFHLNLTEYNSVRQGISGNFTGLWDLIGNDIENNNPGNISLNGNLDLNSNNIREVNYLYLGGSDNVYLYEYLENKTRLVAHGSAFGSNNLIVSGDYSLAFGKGSIASGDYSFAGGTGSTASGHTSFSLGNPGNIASGDNSVAIGYRNDASGDYSTAIGFQNTASASRSFSVGRENTASAGESATIGYGNTASGSQCIAQGYGSTCDSSYSGAFGYNNLASGSGAFALGYDNEIQSSYGYAFGRENYIDGFASSSGSFGEASNVWGHYSNSFGYQNNVIGDHSFAFGEDTWVSGDHSFVIGLDDMNNKDCGLDNQFCVFGGNANFSDNITLELGNGVFWGDTSIKEAVANVVYFEAGGSTKGGFATNGVFGGTGTTGNPYLVNEVSTSTNPVHAFVGDLDTGVGRADADELSLIAGGVEGVRLTETGGAITTNITGNTEIYGTGGVGNLLFSGTGQKIQFGDDQMYIKDEGTVLGYYFGGTVSHYDGPNVIRGTQATRSFQIITREVSTATNPVYTFRNDADTGVGSSGPDSASLTTGGVEALRCTEVGGVASCDFGGDIKAPLGNFTNITIGDPYLIYESDNELRFENGTIGGGRYFFDGSGNFSSNLSVEDLNVRSGNSIIFGILPDFTAKIFALKSELPEGNRSLVAVDSDFGSIYSRPNGTTYIGNRQEDSEMMSISVVETTNSKGHGTAILKFSPNYTSRNLGALYNNQGDFEIRNIENQIAYSNGTNMTFGFVKELTANNILDLVGIGTKTNLMIMEDGFGANPYYTHFMFPVNFLNNTFFKKITAEYVNVTEDLYVEGDINQSGNFTGNQIYGGASNYSDAGWTFPIASSGVYYNITNLTATKLNGVTFVENTSANGGSQLVIQIAGTYKLSGKINFKDGAQNLYGGGIAINGVINRDFYDRASTQTAGTYGNIIATPQVVELDVGDTINLQIEDEANPANDAVIHQLTLYIERVGN